MYCRRFVYHRVPFSDHVAPPSSSTNLDPRSTHLREAAGHFGRHGNVWELCLAVPWAVAEGRAALDARTSEVSLIIASRHAIRRVGSWE